MVERSRDLLIEQVVPEYRAWLRKVASGMLSPAHEALDDLVQEGYVAMWRAVESFDPDKGAAPAWLKASAIRRMTTVVSRNHWTGQAKRTNGGHGGSRPSEAVLSYDAFDYEVADVVLDSGTWVEQADWAYHSGEIAQALETLTPAQRKYVYLRFWCGLSHTEMAPYFGYVPNALWSSAKNGARGKLAPLLAHLV